MTNWMTCHDSTALSLIKTAQDTSGMDSLLQGCLIYLRR